MQDQNIRTVPYSTHFKKLNDMKAWVGKEIGLTEWMTIDQERINTFARITEDEQWIHVDAKKSKLYSPYKTTVAHGFMILSFASKFAYETYSVDDVVMGVNYGLDKVRFPSATPSGADIRGRISLINFEEKPSSARYTLKVVFEIKGQEKPACAAEFIAMAYTQ
jgi:acyl dehydratase